MPPFSVARRALPETRIISSPAAAGSSRSGRSPLSAGARARSGSPTEPPRPPPTSAEQSSSHSLPALPPPLMISRISAVANFDKLRRGRGVLGVGVESHSCTPPSSKLPMFSREREEDISHSPEEHFFFFPMSHSLAPSVRPSAAPIGKNSAVYVRLANILWAP